MTEDFTKWRTSRQTILAMQADLRASRKASTHIGAGALKGLLDDLETARRIVDSDRELETYLTILRAEQNRTKEQRDEVARMEQSLNEALRAEGEVRRRLNEALEKVRAQPASMRERWQELISGTFGHVDSLEDRISRCEEEL